MLNNLRDTLAPTLERIGGAAARTGISPSAWTAIGVGCAVIAAILFARGELVLGGIMLLVSGFFDIIDGQVARITKKASQRGAFLDSVSDRMSEVVVFAGILVGALATPYLVLGAITLSLLVSYARSRAESLGVTMQGVGIGERAERLIIVAIASIIGGAAHIEDSLEYAMIAVCIIAGITLIQRIVHASNALK